MTIKKWSPLKVVSLVMVVSVKVCEEHGMQVMDNADRADTIINAYGLDINHWLNNSPYAHDVPAPVTDGIHAIQITHDLPIHLARLIGYGVVVYADPCGQYVCVVMNKVNLLRWKRKRISSLIWRAFFLRGMVLAIKHINIFV